MIQNSFIPRKFKNIETNKIVDFNELVNSSQISVILGEPASGKTYQLENYSDNNENSILLEPLDIEEKEEKEEEVLLFDSIDEALINYPKIKDYLKRYIKKNKNKKFVITCRYIEWKEKFEKDLKEIDEDLKVYSIFHLKKEEYKPLLKKYNVSEKDFYAYIKEYHLEDLLKNILLIKNIIKDFEEYRTDSKEKNFTKIYEKIVKKHLSLKGKDREEILECNKDINIDDLFEMASSLATYMTLNRKHNISSLTELTGELYQTRTKHTVANLNTLFTTTLFKKFTFFHKSIQEYLTAYFIDLKKLDAYTIKNIYKHKLRFYEKGEEVIIYLTNIQPKLFNDFVEFDPFIFRRHPSLSKEQQEKLFLAIIDKLKNEKQMIWGKGHFFKNSSLVKFNKLDNLEELVKKHITIDEFFYLANILESNYSQEIEDLFFELLNELKNDKELCLEKLKNLELSAYKSNIRLLEFMTRNNCFSNREEIRISSIELHVFKVLYGIEPSNIDKFRQVPFSKLIILLEHFTKYDFEYIIDKISPNDLLIWLKEVERGYSEVKDYKSYSLNWLIYGLLYNYKEYTSLDMLEKILTLLKVRKDGIYFDMLYKTTRDMFLSFDDISNDFWSLFFTDNGDNNTNILLEILKLHRINSKYTNEIINIYPKKEYKKQYRLIEYTINEIEKRENSKVNFDDISKQIESEKIEKIKINNKLKERVKKDIRNISIENYREKLKKFEKEFDNHTDYEKEYFNQLSDKYFDEFILLIIESIKNEQQTNLDNITFFRQKILNIIIALDKFNIKYLKKLINYLSEIPKDIYKKIISYDKSIVLQILSLDRSQYKFIKELLLIDKENAYKYLNALHNINPNQAINDFIEIFKYHEIPTHIDNVSPKNKYDKPSINPTKIEYYKILIKAISRPLYLEKKFQFEKIDIDNIKWILIDYYDFFEEYKRPKGIYSPDIYDKMNDYINCLFDFLQETTQYIDFFENLSNYKNKRLSTVSKSLLDTLYNKQWEERSFGNEYYKNIFDKGMLPITSSLDLFEVTQEIFDKDIRNWIEEEGAYKFINELSQKENNKNAEDLIQKTLETQIKLGFSERKYESKKFTIKREEQLLDDKRLDFTISYPPFGSIVIELKLVHNNEIKFKNNNQPTKKAEEYISKLEQYIKGSKSDFGLFVIFNVKDDSTKEKFEEQITNLKELYSKKENILVIGFNCVK